MSGLIIVILFFLAPTLLGAIMLAIETIKRKLTKQESISKPVAQVPSPQVPSVPRWKRLATERRVKAELVNHDDYGVVRSATRYSPCEWEPLPWTLTVWTDVDESGEVFTLMPHRDVSEDDLNVSVRRSWHEELCESNFRHVKQLDRDQRFHNRLIHRYENDACGTFLIEVRFQGDKVSFFHRPKEEKVPEKQLQNSAPVSPPPPNPFDERIARFVLLHEQYEGAKVAICERKLPEIIELAALAELEEVYQDEVAAEAEKRGGK